MKKLIVLLALVACSTVNFANADDWKLGYKEPGGGFSLTSPDENFSLKFLGYIQANQKFYVSSGYNQNAGNPTDFPYSFLIRRSRFDVSATAFKTFELFFEIDSAPAGGVLPVVTYINAPLFDEYLKIRAGRYITPFSAEDNISSRNLETVERSMVESSLIGLPATDSQIGVMLYGSAMEKTLAYAVSLTNGANSSTQTGSSASGTPVENNGSKDLQLHVSYKLMPDLVIGASYDYDVENGQTLTVKDLAGATYFAAPVVGQRQAYEGDVFYKMGDFSLRGEFITAAFTDSNSNGSGSPSLTGFFGQVGYFVTGSELGGFQPVVRIEQAGISNVAAQTNTLTGITVGYNWFINSCVRHQLNIINTSASNPAGNYADGNSKLAILSELQFKF